MQSQPPFQKAKKLKTLASLATEVNIGNMVMQIAEPQKEGRPKELAPSDFQIKTHDMGPPMHDTMLNVWKYSNVKIEDRLEELMQTKVTLKALNKEFTDYIKATLGHLTIVPVDSATPSTFDPTTKENKNFLVKLQQESHFGQMGRAWIEDMKT